MRKTREEKAITLIALIITIVVLLILAAVAINAVTGDGIIQHATNAKTEYEKAQDEEKDVLSYYEQYLKTEGKTGEWVQNKTTVKNVKTGQIIEVGAYVEYNPLKDKDGKDITASYTSYASLDDENNKNGRISGYTEDQTFTNNYTGTWQVLGVENGQILLVTSTNTDFEYYLASKDGYKYGPEELNAIGSLYGHGKGAESARSIKVEDINRITGFDPLKTGNGKKSNEKEINEYGNEVIYSLNGGKVKSVGKNNVIIETSDYTSFEDIDGTRLGTADGEGTKKEIKIISNWYQYYPTTNTIEDGTDIKGISKESVAYTMLFGKTSEVGGQYWLANNTVGTFGGNASYGIRIVSGECVGMAGRYETKNKSRNSGLKMRLVVKLLPNVSLSEKEGVENTFEIKID